MDKFDEAVETAFASFERRGLLDKLPDETEQGNQDEIFVRPAGLRR